MEEGLSFPESLRIGIIPKPIRILPVPSIPELIGVTVAGIRKIMDPVSLPKGKYRPMIAGKEVGEDYVFLGGELIFLYNPNKK